ncbi:MAG: serine/threonine protein kinase, partial [Deltaproteobacteria bacterium]|nr:serine/threonine protein kinase [Deltaproteobacteria bacterium]
MNRRLGEFQLLRRLAVGGMSEVYLARRVNAAPDDPLIVIKLLLPQVAQDPTFADMFADEARLAEQLDHPNLVHVIAWGEISGEHFLALEYVDGCSLAELLAHRRETGKAPLTPEIALGITESLLTGLGYLHELSDAGGHAVEAVHRDVTPGNVLLSRHGDLKLADFGIARHRLRKSRTKTGIVKGTLQYMAPEQIADDHIDRR